MKANSKKIYNKQEQQENEILYKILFWLGVAVVLEAIVIWVNRYFFHYLAKEIPLATALMSVFSVLQYVALALALIFFVWVLLTRKKESKFAYLRLLLAVLFAGIGVFSFLFIHVGIASISPLLVCIPAGAGLIMIYYLYQKEFFVITFASFLGILGLWIIRSARSNYQVFLNIYVVSVLCLLLAVVIFSLHLRKSGGKINFRGNVLTVFAKGSNYEVLWITCALAAIALLGALIFGAQFAYYAILALVVWLFIMAIYFTSKLM